MMNRSLQSKHMKAFTRNTTTVCVCACVRVGSDLVALLSALENRLYPAAEGL